MMFVLVISSCLANDTDCYKAPLHVDVPQFQCLYNAQPNLAKWLATHPKRKIVGFTCVQQNRLNKFLGGDQA